MTIDVTRLRTDATKAKALRLKGGDTRAKRGSGVFAAVRAALPMIDKLIGEDGVEWADVVAALNEQGVRNRSGEPLTVQRLTSLVDSARKQEVARRARADKRRARADLVTAAEGFAVDLHRDRRTDLTTRTTSGEARRGKLSLSPELTAAEQPSGSPAGAASEEAARREAHDRMGRFVRGQK